jgi:hypothetical protein
MESLVDVPVSKVLVYEEQQEGQERDSCEIGLCLQTWYQSLKERGNSGCRGYSQYP